MSKPIWVWKSMIRDGATLTDPGTETGFTIAALSDLKAFLYWKSNQTAAAINLDIDAGVSGAAADCIALVNSNLATLGATIRIFADAVTIGTTEVLAATTVTDDNVWYQAFTSPGAKRYWRITINHAALPFAAKPYIGEMFPGLKLELPEYLAPTFDPFFRNIEAAGSRSEAGHYLGAILRGEVHRATFQFGPAGAARSAYTASLNSFIDTHALKRYPFVSVLDTADTDFDTARYVRLGDDADPPRSAVAGTWARLGLTMPVEEAFVEAV